MAALPAEAAGKPVEVWFEDEARGKRCGADLLACSMP